MGDDALRSGWSIPPEARRALRLDVARGALRRGEAAQAVVDLEELLDEAPDDVEALWLLAAASVTLGELAVAREAWRALAEAGVDRAFVSSRLAVACFELVDLEEAATWAEAALSSDRDQAVAWRVLGDLRERASGRPAAWDAWEKAWRLDPIAHPLPLELTDAEVDAIVAHAFRLLTPALRKFWRGVPRRIEAFPPAAVLRAATPPLSPRTLALYEGEPSEDPQVPARPEALVIYRGNLAHYESADVAADELAWALEQEAAAWRDPR